MDHLPDIKLTITDAKYILILDEIKKGMKLYSS